MSETEKCEACGELLLPADYCPLCGVFTADGVAASTALIAAAEQRGAALVADKLADLETEQASLCDLLNTWAREEGVQQAERPGEMKSLADRLWGHLSRRVAVAETRGAALAVEQCRRLAEEMAAEHEATADRYGGEGSRSDDWPLSKNEEMKAGALRDLASSFPASPDLAEEVRRIEERGAETTKKRIVTELRVYASGAGHTVKAQALYEAADLIEGGSA